MIVRTPEKVTRVRARAWNAIYQPNLDMSKFIAEQFNSRWAILAITTQNLVTRI